MSERFRVLLIEPWFDGSHRQWAEGYRRSSGLDVDIVALSGELWRWRLRGGALPLAEKVRAWVAEHGRPDVVLVSGLVDVAQLLGLLRAQLAAVPVVIYQHESQLVYPTTSAADGEAALRNWLSWCAADEVWFNSEYHRDSVADRLAPYVERLPDGSHVSFVDEVLARFDVEPLGVDLQPFLRTADDDRRHDGASSEPPVILWSHRWEADKGPEQFGAALAKAEAEGLDFRLVLAGEHPQAGSSQATEAREELATRFAERVLANGPFDRDRYRSLVREADVVVSCASHEFFGIAMVEAMAAGCVPVLPAALSYPELVGSPWHESALYPPGTFGSALVETLRHLGERRRAVAGLAETMGRFDWSVVAPRYDERLVALVESAIG